MTYKMRCHKTFIYRYRLTPTTPIFSGVWGKTPSQKLLKINPTTSTEARLTTLSCSKVMLGEGDSYGSPSIKPMYIFNVPCTQGSACIRALPCT